jgi:hypothetical protein
MSEWHLRNFIFTKEYRGTMFYVYSIPDFVIWDSHAIQSYFKDDSGAIFTLQQKCIISNNLISVTEK